MTADCRHIHYAQCTFGGGDSGTTNAFRLSEK